MAKKQIKTQTASKTTKPTAVRKQKSAALNQYPAKTILDARLSLFNADLGKDKTLNTAFATIYTENSNDWAAISAKLDTKNGFKPDLVKKLEFTHHLAAWSGNNEKLVGAFQQNNKTNSMQDIAANFNRVEFTQLVSDKKAHNKGETAKKLADKLYNDLFNLQPSAMLKRMVEDAKETPITDKKIGGHVAKFLANQPDTFNIKTTSVYEAFKNENAFKGIAPEHHELIKTELKTLQRVTAISPVPEVVPILMKANFTSAMAVSDMPEAQFIQALSKPLGKNGEAIAKQVHANAVSARIRNEQALIFLKEVRQGTGIAMIDKGMKHQADYAPILKKNNLSWDLLFGDANFCECGECTSVYSAASYYVELLQYLRNNNLDPQATGTLANKNDPKDISNTPLEKLFNRRPDLGCLQLTCQNTNTILPYVDLVNEVMESYVAFDKTLPFNVGEDETSGELLSQPQHTEYKAYEILHDAVYPFTLPYHQPIDAARIYLDYLGTSRYELMDTFRSARNTKYVLEPISNITNKINLSPLATAANLEKLYKNYLENAADAEYLGLTQEEYVILTKVAFVSEEYWDIQSFTTGGTHKTSADYLDKIKSRPVHEYYGYDYRPEMLSTNEDTQEGLTFVKKQFLKRTGIQYLELVELLKTQCLNPNVPKGQALSIMDSIQLSYRFLQTLVNHTANNKDEKYKLVINAIILITTPQIIAILNKSQGIDDPCTLETNVHPLTEKEIKLNEVKVKKWVYSNFEKIGKIIVLDNGAKCIDGEVFHNNDNRLVPSGLKVEKCKIVRSDTGAVVGTIDKTTGLITLENGVPTGDWTKLVFVGNKGEKGTFVKLLGSYYLIVNKVDTCDLDTVRLMHLDGTQLDENEYDHIHRFIRLWRKLGWTINEVDCAITCHGGASNFDISPKLLHQLIAVKKVYEKSGIELIKLLTFWTNISTVGEKSLYKRLFLTHNLLSVDSVFHADETGLYLTDATKKISDHIPVLMAALNYMDSDIEAIKGFENIENLTIENVSILYRYRLLSKLLGLQIPDFIGSFSIFGNPFTDAETTLTLLEKWGKVEDAGFNFRQLSYVMNGVDNPRKPLSPSDKSVLQLAKTLYDGLNAIDKAHQDLAANPNTTNVNDQLAEIQAQATTDLVRSKASMLFDSSVVDEIIGILEGTSEFSTKNAPKNLTITIADANSLKAKVKYSKTDGTVQITGILTLTETADYKALSTVAGWQTTLDHIENQQKKLFKEVFSNVFESEKLISAGRKTIVEGAEKVINDGDINIPVDTSATPFVDDNTAVPKRVAFLTVFMSYLRRELARRFIADTLAGLVGLDRRTTDLLICEILNTTDSSSIPIYSIFEKIKDSAVPAATSWAGFLIPPADGDYTFIIKDGATTAPNFTVDDKPLNFTAQADPKNEYWSDNQKLQAGKLYKMSTGINLKNVYWKITTSAITEIPPSALLPDFATDDVKPAFVKLQKAAILVTGFNLSIDEIRYFDAHQSDFGDFVFNQFFLDEQSSTNLLESWLEHWLRIEAYTRLRNSLPQTNTNILDSWKWTYEQPATPSILSKKISELTLWDAKKIEKLIADEHFNLNDAAKFHNEENLLKHQKSLDVADKVGMDIDMLFEWAMPDSNFSSCEKIADNIQQAIRAKYKQEDWEVVAKPLSDKLRENQKDALIAHLLVQEEITKWGVTDANGLFEFFLIDVQMDACMETSRIKQAISSVQLFIQRCFLGLEEEHSSISQNVLDRGRWDWIQRYRVWEANRKVFLYPENWIESNLRDDKSPFFKELESELLQKDISKQNVTDALRSYLYKVDEVANMEIVGVYIEEANINSIVRQKKLHVFSRTRNAPYIFYYRYLDILAGNWYPWEKMQVDIPSYDMEGPEGKITSNGCYLTPVVWNNRLLVFFPQFMKKTKPNDSSVGKAFSDLANDSPNASKPTEYWEIKIAWSEYRNGKWTQKQLSKDAIYDNIPNSVVTTHGTSFSSVASKVRDAKSAAETADNIASEAKIAASDANDKAEISRHAANDATTTVPLQLTAAALIPLGPASIVAAAATIVPTVKGMFNNALEAKQATLNALSKAGDTKTATEDTLNKTELAVTEVTNFEVASRAISPKPIPDISNYEFVPLLSDSGNLLGIKIYYDVNNIGIFEFNGSNITATPIEQYSLNNSVDVNNFHHNSSLIKSLQVSNHIDDYKFDDGSVTTYTYVFNKTINFSHLDAHKLMGVINTEELEQFFKYPVDGVGHNQDEDDVFGGYDQDSNPLTKNIYHELKRPYSIYNWELFFHTPMMLADVLSKAQQFEEAMKWYHYVFNPMADGLTENRFWQFSPFKDIDAKHVLDSIFNKLKPNQPDNEINEWRNNPFKPHLVARGRPVAYMKWVVMKYVDNLVAWGDYLFRQDTIESINQATQLYVLAGHILGPRPQMIPKRGKIKPQSYLSLLGKWDAFSNAMVELEMTLPYSNQTPLPIGVGSGVVGLANVFGFATTTYFCIPNNPKLMGYWDTISDRLFKIRHCENIEGIFRQLPLFEPPIDPALLVNAAAQSLSIASVLNDLNTPMPNYRFYYLLQKALELCGELKSMGGAMLSAIEKKDNETISLIRAKHESSMLNLVMEIKKQQLEEAQKTLDSLHQNRKSPEHRMKYYLQLIGEDTGKVPAEDSDFSEIANTIETPVDESGLKLIKYEKEEYDKSHAAHGWQMGANAIEALSAIFHAIPNATLHASPLGVGGAVGYGGTNLGNAATAASKVIQIISSQLAFESSNAGKKGGFQRALQDRIMQVNAAGYEIKQIDKQILAQQIRIGIANLEITNQLKQIENAQEFEDFLKDKYSNEELYSWMKGSLSALYHQVYSLAFDLSKKAEKVYRFERGLTNSNFIQAGYWDAGRNGLLSGEQLYVGLKQLEAAYQENRGYDYEITKHVSLRQLNPLAILQLKHIGKCEFTLPEVLFDIDYPGHYKRRIKSVSISIPCVAGPYVGLNGTLRLLENKFRNSAIANNYPEKTEETDERFQSFNIPINAIAASSGQNDSGMFELNFKDERYLPFEGAGAISKWRFELPTALRQFDYDTISDVIIHIRYTSAEGGASLRFEAEKNVKTYIRSVDQISKENGLFAIFDLKRDFPNQWYQLFSQNQQSVDFDISGSHFPYLFNGRTLKISETKVFLQPKKDKTFTNNISIDVGLKNNIKTITSWNNTTWQSIQDKSPLTEGIVDLSGSNPAATWTIDFTHFNNMTNIDDLLIWIKYEVTT